MTEKRKWTKKGCMLLCAALMAAAVSLCFIMLNGSRQKKSGLFFDEEFGHIVKLNLKVPFDTPEEELLTLMEQAESLSLFGGIKSLEDLRYFPNLKTLSLNMRNRDNNDLYYLYDTGEMLSLEDASGIRYVKKLEELTVFNQNLGDLSFLEHLDELKKLELNTCTFTNPERIGGCVSLTELSLWRNSLVDLGFLGNLVNLESLELLENDTVCTGFEGLSKLTRMEKLTLDNKAIDQIEFARDMPDLTDFTVQWGKVCDISPLAGHKKLESIALRENQISDLSAFKDLDSLRYLSIDDNYVSDISPLASMKELQYLSIDNNHVSDISPLGELPKLSYLSMGGNPAEDVRPLSQTETLITFIMDRYMADRIQDMTPLLQIPNVSLRSADERMDSRISYSLDEPMAEDNKMELWCEENLHKLRYYKLDDVSYGDMDGDGVEDAAIVLSYGTEEVTLSGSETYPWKQAVLALKGNGGGEFHPAGEFEIRKRKGVIGDENDYVYTNTLLRNGNLLIQESYGNSRADEWYTVTRYFSFENGTFHLLQSNQYNCSGNPYTVYPSDMDRVVMLNAREGSRTEYLLAYNTEDLRSTCWRKLPVTRNTPPDMVIYREDGTGMMKSQASIFGTLSQNVTVSPYGFIWNYVVDGERYREQDTSTGWNPSAKSPKSPVHPLSLPGAFYRSVDSLSPAEAEGGSVGAVTYYLDCDACPDQLTVYEWLLAEKSEDGMGYYMQPWPDSEQSLDLSKGMPVTVSFRPGRLYEIVAVWDGGTLSSYGYSGEAQYLLEIKTPETDK